MANHTYAATKLLGLTDLDGHWAGRRKFPISALLFSQPIRFTRIGTNGFTFPRSFEPEVSDKKIQMSEASKILSGWFGRCAGCYHGG